MSTASLHAYMVPPPAVIISKNSSTGGISNASICFLIIPETAVSTPGNPPSIVGKGKPPGIRIAGFPVVAVCRWFIVFLVIPSRPKKVKNTFVSIPSITAPLALTNVAYTSSKEPLAHIIQTFSKGFFSFVSIFFSISFVSIF